MATSNISIAFKLRWWLKLYLIGVLLTARITHCPPNQDRVRYWVNKGLKVETR